jgi:hypothetical protein
MTMGSLTVWKEFCLASIVDDLKLCIYSRSISGTTRTRCRSKHTLSDACRCLRNEDQPTSLFVMQLSEPPPLLTAAFANHGGFSPISPRSEVWARAESTVSWFGRAIYSCMIRYRFVHLSRWVFPSPVDALRYCSTSICHHHLWSSCAVVSRVLRRSIRSSEIVTIEFPLISDFPSLAFFVFS